LVPKDLEPNHDASITSLSPQPEKPQSPPLLSEQWKYADMDGIQMEECLQCKEKWFEVKLDWGEGYKKCVSAQKRKAMPYVYGEGNAMDSGEMPDGLQPLAV
jgi:hypothetical protein